MNRPSDAELQSMAVNERLFSLGLMDQWDAAAKARDRDRMIEVLGKCAMTPEQSEQTTDAVLKNPSMYGF